MVNLPIIAQMCFNFNHENRFNYRMLHGIFIDGVNVLKSFLIETK